MVFAFISRHAPTEGQTALAAEQGITLVHVGDADGFKVGPSFVDDAAARLEVAGGFEGVVVVHAGAALRLAPAFLVGVFENANRAPVGAPSQFEAVALHLFDLRD